jgi:glycosyltransferase involved in cell wall biosynthesis
LGKNVTLLGRRRDVNRLLSKSRLFVLLSDSEGMSIAMLESMMSGTPVVVVNVGELESVVKCAEAGVVLQSRCPEYVASELNSLLEVPDRMARMGTSARAYALQHFTPRTIGGVWDRVISDHARSRAT